MACSGSQIVAKIRARIEREGSKHENRVFGTSRQPRTGLFTAHGVRDRGDCWTFMPAESAAVACKVHAFLVKTRGMAGSTGVVVPAAEFVYACQRSAHTKPRSALNGCLGAIVPEVRVRCCPGPGSGSPCR